MSQVLNNNKYLFTINVAFFISLLLLILYILQLIIMAYLFIGYYFSLVLFFS